MNLRVSNAIFAIIFLGGVATTQARAALVIDTFSVSQSVTVNTNNGTTASTLSPTGLFVNTLTNTSVVTADREILARLSSAANQSRTVTLSSNSEIAGFLALNTSPDVPLTPAGHGAGEVVYELASGADSTISSFGENPNVFALNLNFTQFGNQFELTGRVTEVTSAPVFVTVYGAGAQSGLTATAQFDLSSALTTYQRSFNLFTGDQSVFSNVGAVRVLLGSGETLNGTSADIHLDYLSITGSPAAVPEPSTMALLGAGLIGLVVAARKRTGQQSR